ncbi:hypothetical protein DEU56DRAFT_743985, partial [Suillus clintonianus]|uniref:uncharacterized protein n=1 Tax=Suillus clintonianus TaxID=1904413 RepID=UPI001B87BE4E
KIDDKVNALYIAEVIQRVWDNETKKPEMLDEDYTRSVITTIAKSYWRNLSQQVSSHLSPEKTEKLTNKQINSRRRGRRQTAANHRHEAVPEFERSYEHQGSVALIDTDYGSDILSYDEAKLSTDTKDRRKDQGQGKTSCRVVGLEWQSIDYVAFLRMLDEIHRCGGGANTQDRSTEPSAKRHKLAKGRGKGKETLKMTFDAHPSDMSHRLPKSGKSTALLNTMVDAVWLERHKEEVKVVEGAEWPKEFRKNEREEDLALEDKKYLAELEEWQADEEDNTDE